MSATAPIVEAHDLHTYYGPSHVLSGVSLSIARGETLGVMGRNGMGKTTTIRSLLGLTPPSRGVVRIHGRPMTGAPAHRIARQGLALVPEGRRVFPDLTARENLVMSARPDRDGRQPWTLAAVLELFPLLAPRLRHRGDRLSGGEQQMLAIGRALMTNPDLLILDEATEGLAPMLRRQVWSVIDRLKEAGMAFLLVDRDLEALLRVSDRAIVLHRGEVVFSGSSRELAESPAVHHRYLGV